MKSDLDAIMQANQTDALLVVGPAKHNPYMVYLTGGGHLTMADLLKKRGEEPILFCSPMERDEAAHTGLSTRSYSDYPWKELFAEAGGDRLKAMALRYRRMFQDAGITSGRVALYGQTDLGSGYALIQAVQELMPELEFTGFQPENVLLRAMMTKDPEEIERIRRMGEVTTRVVQKTADYLTGHTVRDEMLVHTDGTPLKLGEVKSQINLWLAEHGVENPEDTIFSIGRDAGVPHSSGNPEDLMRLGQTIVFDIFPCEAGGGYFYDFTRTWCLGYAPEEAQQLYDQVHSVYDQLIAELKVNERFSTYQERTCELFEAMGHPSVGSDPGTNEGYVHSIGHGVGLHIHEQPFSGPTAGPQEILAPGAVFTIEPGLYYPERGLGVRLEDTYYVTPEGSFKRFVDFPMDLVLPVKR
jgi:Xaa-Pro aminopeptidase